MSDSRKPLVLAMFVVVAVALLLELGTSVWISGAIVEAAAPTSGARPGLGIPSLALVDGLLLVTVTVATLTALGVNAALVGRVQGIGLGIAAVVVFLIALPLLFAAIGLLMLMVGLLLSVPFGTAIYLASWGNFPRGAAAATLGALLLFKLVAAGCFLLGFAEALKSRAVVLVFASSIGLTFLLIVLHGLVPRPLVSITDTVGAIVAFVLAMIWAIVYLIGAIRSIVRVLRVDRLGGVTETPR